MSWIVAVWSLSPVPVGKDLTVDQSKVHILKLSFFFHLHPGNTDISGAAKYTGVGSLNLRKVIISKPHEF